MSGFNLPPGVSASDEHINPSDTWEALFDQISKDCERERWTDIDCLVAWFLGRDALKAARSVGAKFPHDS